MREIALDTETTGFDPATGHKVVEIGCVEMFGRIKTGAVYHVYLNPERDMPEEAFRVHGLSSEFLSDKPCFRDVVGDFRTFIADTPLIIHNAAFDMRFINAELEQVGHEPLPMTIATDTVVIAKKKFPGAPANLDALCRRFNIDLSKRTHHGALLDADLLADVYLELMGGRQATMELAAEVAAIMETSTEMERTYRAARSFPVSEQELASHAKLVEKLKNPLWKQQETV